MPVNKSIKVRLVSLMGGSVANLPFFVGWKPIYTYGIKSVYWVVWSIFLPVIKWFKGRKFEI